MEMDLSAGTYCTQSLLQGDQLQESVNKFCNFLPQIDGKVANSDAKWCQNGVCGPSGAKIAPGRQKRCLRRILSTHFGGHFGDFWAPFSMPFFDAFVEGLFFASWATFGCQRCPKGSQNGAKMEPKASLGVPSGKCKKHGRGYVFST